MDRLIIIEGIAGSGKDTLQDQLEEKYKKYSLFSFREAEVLQCWRHAWINNIADMRLEFIENFLDYVKKMLEKNEDTIFIVSRFHISFMLFNYKDKYKEKYERVLQKIRDLPAKVMIPVIEKEEINTRSRHEERPDIWKDHLKRRMDQQGFENLVDMYVAEQKRVLNIAEEQNIPFEALRVKLEGTF